MPTNQVDEPEYVICNPETYCQITNQDTISWVWAFSVLMVEHWAVSLLHYLVLTIDFPYGHFCMQRGFFYFLM